MKIIDDILVTDDLGETCFVCKLSACFGNCCVEGDAGAPLEEEEISLLEDHIDAIKPFMTAAGLAEIEKTGVFDFDADGSFVTPLVNHRECAFSILEDKVSFCAIERACIEHKTPFQKPISCHLYPVRLSKVGGKIAVNYHKWGICAPALSFGKDRGVPLYRFVQDGLVRKFGKEWFEKLEASIRETNSDKMKK